MGVLVDVIIEIASILLMGIVCFIIYIYARLFLIKIGLIDDNRVDESDKGNEKN